MSNFGLLHILMIGMYISNGCAFLTSHLEYCPHQSISSSSTTLTMAYNRNERSHRSGQERTKRQGRVGQLILFELARIIHSGNVKGDAALLDDELRKRISIVNANVSPDLRQARITVSVRRSPDSDVDIDRRRAFSWLVKNGKQLRYTLAQRMSHMKTSAPQLTFAQADIAAAVDVMYLIDQIAAGNDKREAIDFSGESGDSLPRGMVGGMDFDDLDEDEEDWIDEDGDDGEIKDGITDINWGTESGFLDPDFDIEAYMKS